MADTKKVANGYYRKQILLSLDGKMTPCVVDIYKNYINKKWHFSIDEKDTNNVVCTAGDEYDTKKEVVDVVKHITQRGMEYFKKTRNYHVK